MLRKTNLDNPSIFVAGVCFERPRHMSLYVVTICVRFPGKKGERERKKRRIISLFRTGEQRSCVQHQIVNESKIKRY